jgi:hypothetical protein
MYSMHIYIYISIRVHKPQSLDLILLVVYLT